MEKHLNDPIKIKNSKYITWLIILAGLSIYMSGRIEYWMPDYSHMDQAKYRIMAQAFPYLSPEVIQPYAYRVLAPWIAGGLPFKVEISFYVLSILSLLSLTVVLYKFLITQSIEKRIAFGLTACFVFNRYFFQQNAWNYFQLTDLLSLITIMLIIINLYKKEWVYLLLLFTASVLIKETVLILIPFAFFYLYSQKWGVKEYMPLIFISILTLLLFLFVRIIFIDITGENLWNQFYTGIEHFFSIEGLLKRLIIAFVPFGLVPLLFYRETLEFFGKSPHYIAYFVLVFAASFFGDGERLMLYFGPVYFVMISFIIQKHLAETINKLYLRKFLIYLMVISFLSSFYHLWGIIKFPVSIYSLVSAILFSTLTAYLFWQIKYSGKNVS